MIYIFVDESGDYGGESNHGASSDFSMAAVICYTGNIDILSRDIIALRDKLNKKEIKFSKLSQNEIVLITRFLSTTNIENYSIYTEKTKNYFGERLLKNSFTELLDRVDVSSLEKVKIIIDGVENRALRKIYEPIMRKRFTRSVLRFANSQKTPLIQIADFCAGHRRRMKR